MMETIFEPYAVRLVFTGDTVLSARNWGFLLCQFMDGLARHLTKQGNCVIGHLKGFAQVSENGFMRISVTSPDHPADIAGEFKGAAMEITLSLNVLVYGLAQKELAVLTRQMMDMPEKPWSNRVRALAPNPFLKAPE